MGVFDYYNQINEAADTPRRDPQKDQIYKMAHRIWELTVEVRRLRRENEILKEGNWRKQSESRR